MKWNQKNYKEKIEELHPELTLVSEYKSLREYVLVEDKLGIIYRVFAQGLFKSKPSFRAAVDKTDAFKRKAVEIHGNKYDYSKVKYSKSSEKVCILCPIHGEFLQTPSQHIHVKHGCPMCKNTWALNKDSWLLYTTGKECKFYAINCFNSDENFIKFGITSQSVESRFFRDRDMPYDYEIILDYTSDGETIWELEQYIHNHYSNSRYIPKLKFGGATECFKTEVLEDSVKILKQKINDFICKKK